MMASGSRKPGAVQTKTAPQYPYKYGSGVKKSKSEELLATLKLLGYSPPKQFGAEKYDYLFQDAKVERFIKNVTNKITNQNVVGKDEMSQIEKLKQDDRLVYGKALEKLIQTRKKQVESEDTKLSEKEKELEELKQRIQDKKEQIQKLKELEKKFIKNEEDRTSENAVLHYENQLINDECKRIRKELSAEKPEQEEIQAKCLEKINNRMQGLHASSIKSLAEIVEKGAKVEIAVRDRMRVKMDFESELVSGPMTPFEICKAFEQYGKDLERLKHVLIYEFIRQIQNDCKNASYQVVSTNLPSFKISNQQMLKLAPDIQSKMLNEKQESVALLQKSVASHVDKKLDFIRQQLVTKLDNDTRQLQLRKYESREQIKSYYKVFVDILLKHFANLLIYDCIISKKNEEAVQFVNCLKKFCNSSNTLKSEMQYLKSDINPALLSGEQKKIAQLFRSNGISLEILRSPEATAYAISLIQLKEKHQLEKEKMKKEAIINQKIKNLSQSVLDLTNQWKMNEPKRLQWTADYEHITKLEEDHEKIQEEIKTVIRNKDKLVKEAIKSRKEIIEEINQAIKNNPIEDEDEIDRPPDYTAGRSQKRRISAMFRKSLPPGQIPDLT